MARHKDPAVAEVKKVRGEISRRLVQAKRRGKMLAELKAIEREGDAAHREMTGESKSARRRKRA